MSRGRRRSTEALAALALVVLTLGAARPAHGQAPVLFPVIDPAPGEPAEDVRIVWRNRPQIRIGDDVRIDLRARLQNDWRVFDPEIGEDTYQLNAMRFSVNGEIADDVEFQVEYDTQNDRFPWRDVYGEWKTFRQFTVRGGQFKVPFGLEQNTPFFEVDYAFRTLASSVITPNRDIGAMASGRFLRRGITYAVGVFRHDGQNGEIEEPQFVPPGQEPERQGPSVAGRVTALPLRWAAASLFDSFRVGLAATASNLPEGLNSLHSEGRLSDAEFFDPVYVKGYRRRLGTELEWTPGPASVKGEWMRAFESRDDQGLGDVDLSDVWSTAWYLSGTWVLTGEDKEGGVQPAAPIFRGGFGAVEVGARYEILRFESADKVGPPERNPRAEHILPNQDSMWTLGANWYLNRWVRVVANAIHEHFDDPERTPLVPVQDFWAGVFRVQVTF